MNAAQPDDPFEHAVDPSVHCTTCDAVCCRLTVVLGADDAVPPHLVTRNVDGVAILARSADGWCVALDRERMRCGIYAARPAVCRKFAMGGPYCREERSNYRSDKARGIPLKLR